MEDYYRILGVNTSATSEEIRRAYRILARRYHPDVNPGRASEEKFKLIAVAYDVLSDPAKRKAYDIEFQARGYIRHPHTRPTGGKPSATQRFYETKLQNFGQMAQESSTGSKQQKRPSPKKPVLRQDVRDIFKDLTKKASGFFSRQHPRTEQDRAARQGPRTESAQSISIVEVSIGMREAILGGKKLVEVDDPSGTYKVALKIPAGVRSGSVLRMKSARKDELVFIVRVASHPYLSIQTKGLVADLPISIAEAISGTSLKVPTLDDPVSIQIPSGSQSGTEIRLKERGITNSDGSRGDLFYRLLVHVPTCYQAVGIQEKSSELAQYYEQPVRQSYPVGNLLEQP